MENCHQLETSKYIYTDAESMQKVTRKNNTWLLAIAMPLQAH